MYSDKRIATCAAAAVLLGFPATVRGQFESIQSGLFRGLELLGTRNFISTPQNGPLFDFNIFRQRVERNRTGGGFTYEEFRFFGPDTYDNPNTIDLGVFKIQLGSDPTIVASGQPIGVHNRIGYTTRIIPELFFESQTGQRSFDIFSGLSTFTPTPLRYNIDLDTGVQRYTWAGNVLVDSEGKINALGFYDYRLRLVNVGNYTADGFLVNDEQVTDFDTGTINVRGHVLMDAVAALFQLDGSALNAAPPRIFSAASGKDKTVDDLLAELKAGNRISDEEMQFLVEQMFVTAFRNDPLGFIQNGPPDSVPGFEALQLQFSPAEPGQPTGDGTVAVPEAGTLLLLAVAGMSFHVLRRRGRRLAD